MILLSLFACQTDNIKTDRDPLYLEAGAPVAGTAEGPIDFPIGAPMGGYSSRCNYLGGAGSPDNRQSQYALAFSPTVGVQTTPFAEVLWLEAGNSEMVMINADIIYVFDGMIDAIESELTAYTGRNMDGKVMLSASHTHNAPANFSDAIHFYLGGDRYNHEIFSRFVRSVSDIAITAFDSREDVQIGFSVHKDWDPDDLVYRDRRPDNDELAVWEDAEPGYGKDPYLWMMRIDTLSGDPLGVFFNFGIHGTALNDDNALMSIDAPGHIELALRDYFETPVVVSHFQGAGGDVSPVGNGDNGFDYAVMEGLGHRAAPLLYTAWLNTPVVSDPFTIESVTHAIPEGLEIIEVTRNGTVDWRYQPFEKDYVADNIIYDANGDIQSPLDEFNAEFGAAFCGYDDPLISTGTIGAEVYPYDGCTQVDLVSYILNAIFSLNEFYDDGEAPLPLPDTLKANTSTARVGPVLISDETGTQQNDNILMGFFPGEVTGMYAEQYRRRSKAELDFDHTLTVGYAQDHEGYLLIPEDWLVGGYEANINIWGPLQGEHIMEGNLKMANDYLLSDFIEPQDPTGEWGIVQMPERPVPTFSPDDTPLAGTTVSIISEDLYLPFETLVPQHTPDSSLQRVQEIAQFMWEGGDPGVDSPLVVIETNIDGQWVELTSPSGRIISHHTPDVLLIHLPSPLYPYDAMQSHQYWAGWQTVGSHGDATGLPIGEYRFHIYGNSASSTGTEWPWPAEPYEVVSPAFSVEPASLTITQDGSDILVSLVAPDWGYRLISLDGSSNGGNAVTIQDIILVHSDGSEEIVDANEVIVERSHTRVQLDLNETVQSIYIEDLYGNYDQLEVQSK